LLGFKQVNGLVTQPTRVTVLHIPVARPQSKQPHRHAAFAAPPPDLPALLTPLVKPPPALLHRPPCPIPPPRPALALLGPAPVDQPLEAESSRAIEEEGSESAGGAAATDAFHLDEDLLL
jgi:hypothetical protein